ncbi:E3 SUMO-protein ligase ZBED1-like [Diretmus argenteus]
MAKRVKKSPMWDYFIADGNTVRCKLCDAALQYTSSTSTMMYHVKNKHPGAMCEAGGAQPKITSMFGGRQCDARRSENVTQLVHRMIEKDMLPISVVQCQGFIELINYLEPQYEMPSRDTVTKRIEKHYKVKKEELHVKLARADKLALTTDCWTALTTESYITVTSHFIDADWDLQSNVLVTESLPVWHTAVNLSEKLTSVVESWGLTGRILACVHDNASNIVAANSATSVPWGSVPCYAHTLQLAINDGFSVYLSRVIAAAGRLVKHFHHSHPATMALGAKQEQMSLAKHALIQSTKTRWNSVCDMFERLVEQRWAVTAVLSDLCDHCFVSISNIYPITFGLLEIHLLRKEDDSRRVCEFKSEVRASLKRRLQVDSAGVTSLPPVIASMLDPRHKHLPFLSPGVKENVKVELLELASSVGVPTDDREPAAASASEMEQAPRPAAVASASAPRAREAQPRQNAMELLLGEKYLDPVHVEGEAEKEVEHFLREVCPSLEVNPLRWWKENERRYPRLATLARGYLAIPGSVSSLLQGWWSTD